MASPQIENGFTRIANELLETIQTYKFTLNEMKIIMCVWRFTYGFQRKSHTLSLSFFTNHTGLNRSRINDSLKNLINSNVLVKTSEGDSRNANSYKFNKCYTDWKIEKYSLFEGVEIDTSVQINTSVQNETSTSVQDDTSTSVQSDTQERKVKDNSKEIKDNVPFDEVVSYLNQKANTNYRANGKKTRTLINARWNEKFTLEDFYKVIDNKSSQWLGDSKMETYLRPETLFGTKFESYLNEKGGSANGVSRTSVGTDDEKQSKISETNERRKRLAGIQSDRNGDNSI